MDPFTHALASYTLKRAAFPRVPRFTTTAMLVAGTISDLDLLSAYFGPSAFLTFYRTYCHSLLAALLFSLLVTLPFLLRRRGPTEIQTSPLPVFLAVLAATVVGAALALLAVASGWSRPGTATVLGVLTGAFTLTVLLVARRRALRDDPATETGG